ncbi:hypothetical protein FQN57_002825 [Myotisia sp. PD_48]|nr:hypothetical protein FQN57_002825 [Myotisia sp. PD_48]
MSQAPSVARRVITVIAATCIALACGTNYAYSAWAPQFAERMKLSSIQTNLIGTAGNVGVYATGFPLGYLVDSRGPRSGAFLGSITLFIGYFPIHRAYAAGAGSMSVAFLCLFSFLSGMGSCSAFMASIKTSASNFPNHRGSATAFPLAAFGLSAFFFSTLSALAFKDDTSLFLLVLAVGTSSLIFVSTFFLHVFPSIQSYSSVPEVGSRYDPESSRLRRTSASENRRNSDQSNRNYAISSSEEEPQLRPNQPDSHVAVTNMDETSSLMSRSSSSTEYNLKPSPSNDSLYTDVRGFAILLTLDFWLMFLLLGISTGIGLMTINNIGTDIKALWAGYDEQSDPGFLQKQQAVHVSTISTLSFGGRLLSGFGSDFIARRFHLSRYWCIFISSIFFFISQLAGHTVSDPHHLIILSSVTGLAYGILYGAFPSIVAQTFGISGLSQNWGFLTLAAAVFGNIFNLIYGAIYDSHSITLPDGERDCNKGLKCYSTAYLITAYSSVVCAGLTLLTIWHARRVLFRRRNGESRA